MACDATALRNRVPQENVLIAFRFHSDYNTSHLIFWGIARLAAKDAKRRKTISNAIADVYFSILLQPRHLIRLIPEKNFTGKHCGMFVSSTSVEKKIGITIH